MKLWISRLTLLLVSATAALLGSISIASPAAAEDYRYKSLPACYDRPGPGGVDCGNQDYYNNFLHSMRPDDTSKRSSVRMTKAIFGLFQPYMEAGQAQGANAGISNMLRSGPGYWSSERARCMRKAAADLAWETARAAKIKQEWVDTFYWANKAVSADRSPSSTRARNIVSAYLKIGGQGVKAAYRTGMNNQAHTAGQFVLYCQNKSPY